MTSRLFLLALSLLALLPPVSGRAQEPDFSPLVGYVVTVPLSYDDQSHAVGGGIDLNVVAFIFNGGVSWRHWDEAVQVWEEGKMRRDEVTGYAGLGLVNLLQAQAGFSSSGVSLRLRSDIVLFGDENSKSFRGVPGLFSSYRSRWGPFRQGLAVSPYVEISPWSSNTKVVYGVGLGVIF